MGDANITTSAWRLVEVGRVVLFNEGQYEGRLATVVEIIDHKRVCKARELDVVQGLTKTTGAC
jgi:ribosomal protein L14E/L6E/L27E